MTKPPIPTENSKTKGQHTQTKPKTSITQRLRTDLGRSVGVTSNPTGLVKPVYESKLYWFQKCLCSNSGFYCFWKRASWKTKLFIFRDVAFTLRAAALKCESKLWRCHLHFFERSLQDINNNLNKKIMTNDMKISCRFNGYKAYGKNFKCKWNIICSSELKGNLYIISFYERNVLFSL